MTDAVIDAIRAHGRETYPNECCGALIGRDGACGDAGAPNTTEEGRAGGFSCGPAITGRPKRAPANGQASCSASIIRIPIIPRSRRSTTSITRGRSSRM